MLHVSALVCDDCEEALTPQKEHRCFEDSVHAKTDGYYQKRYDPEFR